VTTCRTWVTRSPLAGSPPQSNGRSRQRARLNHSSDLQRREGWRARQDSNLRPRLRSSQGGGNRGSTTLLPLISLTFGQAPDHPRLPRAATHCQSFVSRLSPRVRDVRSRDASTSWFDHHEGRGETLTEFIDDVHNRLTQIAAHSGEEADQHHTCGLLSVRVSEQTAGILVPRMTGLPSITRGLISMRAVSVIVPRKYTRNRDVSGRQTPGLR
jgi:hypothetical protein